MTAYVANQLSETVTPIQTATNTAGKAIRVGDFPDYIAITPNGRTVYVANFLSSTVTRIRTATDKRLRHVQVGGGPDYIAMTP